MLLSPADIPLSPTLYIFVFLTEIFDPEVSIASPPIFLKKELIINPLEKSESIPSDVVFLISLSLNSKFELIRHDITFPL